MKISQLLSLMPKKLKKTMTGHEMPSLIAFQRR